MAIIPKNQNQDQLFSSELRSGLSWRIFIFFLVTFAIAFLSYLGLEFGYKAFLSASIADLDAEIEEARTRIGIEEQENLIIFNSQLANLKTLIGSHIFGSKILAFMESATHGRVAYSAANLTVEDRTLALEGVTDSYATLVSQIVAYENAPGVENIILGSNSFDGGLVKFSVKVVFARNFFLYNPRVQAP